MENRKSRHSVIVAVIPLTSMETDTYNSPTDLASRDKPKFQLLAWIGLVDVTLLTALALMAILQGYAFLSRWCAYQGNRNTPSIVWRGRFNVKLMLQRYQHEFVTLLMSASRLFTHTLWSASVFRTASTITALGFAYWIAVGLKYLFYRI